MGQTELQLDNLETVTDRFMQSVIGMSDGIPGGAVVIVHEGKTILQKGYGFSDLAEQKPVDPERTLFRIGSVTKTMTAAAVMRLVDAGKLALHDDIQYLLPDIELDNPFEKPVTVHHLLTHTSGFEYLSNSEEDFRQDLNSYVSIADYLKGQTIKVVREPGSAYMYDNLAYNLLGYILEKVSGEAYEAFMQKELFANLNMDASHALLKEALLPDLAVGYGQDRTEIAPYVIGSSASASGGMLMTAENMSHFLKALQEGRYAGKTVWSDEALASMLEYQVQIHPSSPDVSYGMENWLRPQDTHGQRIIMKGGDVPGYSSFMMYLPEHKLGMFFTFNQMAGSAGLGREWIKQFMNACLADRPAEPDRKELFQPQSKQELKKLEGNYTDLRVFIVSWQVEATGDGEITVTDTSQRQGEGIKLKQLDEDLFVDPNGEILAFHKGEDGKVTHLKYTNPVAYAERRSSRFEDLDQAGGYAKDIERLASIGMIRGIDDKTFAPYRQVTKGEWTVMLMRMLGLHNLSVEPSSFTDAAGHWSAREVSAAMALGLAMPDSENFFGVNRTLSRQEAAFSLVYAVKHAAPYLITSDIATAADKVRLESNISGEWGEAVRLIVAAGLPGEDIRRNEGGTVYFRGDDKLTRQEMAQWVLHFIKLYY